ncbi:hypothetical protein [Cytobacillus solani]
MSFTDYFNKASFLERNDIFPGDEKLFLRPETNLFHLSLTNCINV